ncbi:MAG: hypothetical protein PHI85_04240 [Victivallaceae bacterium]|nr:hypothetical protein [Victivallaceae bacterium]
MRILEISRPTLRRYASCGALRQIATSPRRVRFDRLEVERLANCGRATR